MDNISKHISYKEATQSSTGIRLGLNNDPNADQLEAMKLVAEKVFEPVRNYFKVPLGVNSFFRSYALNKAIGGAPDSQHCKGEAIDIDSQGDHLNKAIFDYIKNNLEFDQLISEFGTEESPAWIHVSFKKRGNRKSVLRAEKINGLTVYRNI